MYLLAPWCFIMYIMFGRPKIIILLKLTPIMSVLWVQATHEQFKMRFVPGYFSLGLNSKGLNNFWWWYDLHEIVLLDASTWWIIIVWWVQITVLNCYVLLSSLHLFENINEPWIFAFLFQLLHFMLHCLDGFTICLSN